MERAASNYNACELEKGERRVHAVLNIPEADNYGVKKMDAVHLLRKMGKNKYQVRRFSRRNKAMTRPC